MAKLDRKWLSVFDEIYKTASVTRAAVRLGIAPASASTVLNKLLSHLRINCSVQACIDVTALR